MTWWTDYSTYTRNVDDLRQLASLILIKCGTVIGQQIYPIVTAHGGEAARSPYTIDFNERPAITAILIAMIDPENVSATPREEIKSSSAHSSEKIASLHPTSIKMASKIASRKSVSPRLVEASAELSWMLSIMLRAWYCQKKQNNRAVLPTEVRLRIQLFAETVVRAAQIYRETLYRNRILWDSSDADFIGASAASEFNLAFDMSYIKLAINDLNANYVSATGDDVFDSDSVYSDLPELIHDM